MWNPDNYKEFISIVGDLLEDPDVLSMREQPQHSKTMNCLDHSIYVAYLSFLISRKFKLDFVAAARGGLLHDLHLKNWDEEDDGIRRLWRHPHYALENAAARYNLSNLEKDIIVKHMWPLTRPLPRHKESFVVSIADKICAISERVRLHRALKVQQNLSPVAA